MFHWSNHHMKIISRALIEHGIFRTGKFQSRQHELQFWTRITNKLNETNYKERPRPTKWWMIKFKLWKNYWTNESIVYRTSLTNLESSILLLFGVNVKQLSNDLSRDSLRLWVATSLYGKHVKPTNLLRYLADIDPIRCKSHRIDRRNHQNVFQRNINEYKALKNQQRQVERKILMVRDRCLERMERLTAFLDDRLANN